MKQIEYDIPRASERGMQSDEVAQYLAVNEEKVIATIENEYLYDQYERRREEQI